MKIPEKFKGEYAYAYRFLLTNTICMDCGHINRHNYKLCSHSRFNVAPDQTYIIMCKKCLNKQSLPFFIEDIKIIKKDEILKVCKSINSSFTTRDVRRILKQSDNKEIRNITFGYISGQLGKLVQANKLKTIMRAKWKGSPNIFSNIEGGE